MGQLLEILEKFQNGETRYNEDPDFNAAIQFLLKGVGVYALLDSALRQLKVIREIHQRTIEQNKHLAEENEGLNRDVEYWKQQAQL